MDRDRYSICSPSASDLLRLRIAPCQAIGKETFLPERTIRTSPHSSSATAALRCSSSFQGILVKLPRKDTTTVVATLAKHIRKLPEELRRSLTWDQGKEMSGHKRFTVATNVQVYFCTDRLNSPSNNGLEFG